MSKSVTIPSFNDPFVVEVNNTKYSYPAGTTQTVPDEVACVIDNINANMPKEAPEDGVQGQVWTKQEKSAAWANSPNELPTTGTTGHYLKKTATGCEWAAVPSYTLPAATAEAIGGVKKAAAVEDIALEEATASGVGSTVNALLSALRSAGIMVFEA